MYYLNRKTPVKELNKPVKKIPKSLLIYFVISQVFLGIDLGFGMAFKRIINYIMQRFTIVLSLAYIVILMGPFTYISNDIWYIPNFVEYALYFIILNTSQYTMFNFLAEVNVIFKLSVNETNVLISMTIFYTFFMFAIKALFIGIPCMYENIFMYCVADYVVYALIYCLPFFGLDIIAVAQIIIYYYIYCLVKKLREDYVRSEIDSTIFEQRYKNIVDHYDRIKPLYSKIIMVQVGVGVPKLMGTLWFMLHQIKLYGNWFSFCTELITSIHTGLQIIFPALMGEMVNSQVDVIKHEFSEQIMIETDETRKTRLIHMLKYMKRRTLQHFVCRFIPVDRRLLTSLFSLCTSYFIVIIQFTHLYD